MDSKDSKQAPTLGGTPEGRIQRYFCVDDDGCHAFERLSRDAEVVRREPKTVQVDGREITGWIVEVMVAATDGVVRFDPIVESDGA
jgi:hypothetical protein